MKNSVVVSELDKQMLSIIRSNVVSFMRHCSMVYGKSSGILLDIAPQEHEGARPFFAEYICVKTLDIDPQSGCDFIADICAETSRLLIVASSTSFAQRCWNTR